MGYKDDIFEEQVDDELKCPICNKVLESPVQGIHCEHLFCFDCIQQWLKANLICPLDSKPLLPSQLQPPPKIILKLLNNLKIKCNFYDYGCPAKLKLSDLSQHVKMCLYNSNQDVQTDKKPDLSLKDSSNEIKRFRIAGDLSVQINEMNRVVNELNSDLEYENKKSIDFAKNLEIAQRNYDNLNLKFKHIVNPFLNLLKSNYESDRLPNSGDEKENSIDPMKKKPFIGGEEESQSAIVAEERRTCTAVIRNLNEFLNEQIVEEYLRQNGIPTLSCELELTIVKRSRDFKVTIYKSDFNKLFNENLWPCGVTCHNLASNNKDNRIIFGKRQTDLPCLVIKSGLALSYY